MTRPQVPIRYLAALNRSVLPESTDPNFEFRYVDISQVDGNGSLTMPSEIVKFSDAPTRARRLAPPGAVAISTVRTYLRAITAVPAFGEPVVFSTGFAIVEPLRGLHPRYLYYAATSSQFIEQVVARSVGVSYPAISPDDLAQIPVPMPALDEQRRIADFLDDQTTRIDQIVIAREEQDRLLQQAEQAVIDEVWRTGVQVPIRRALKLLRDGTHQPPERQPDGVPLFTAKNIREHALSRTLQDTYISTSDANLLDRSVVPRDGDVLFSIKGSVGYVAVVPSDFGRFQIDRNLALMRVDRDRILPDWLYWTLRSSRVQEQVSLQMGFSAQPGIYLGSLASVMLPLPDVASQKRTADGVQREVMGIRSARGSLAKSRRLLVEMKRSLISAAVSGEFDVSSASGKGVPV